MEWSGDAADSCQAWDNGQHGDITASRRESESVMSSATLAGAPPAPREENRKTERAAHRFVARLGSGGPEGHVRIWRGTAVIWAGAIWRGPAVSGDFLRKCKDGKKRVRRLLSGIIEVVSASFAGDGKATDLLSLLF